MSLDLTPIGDSLQHAGSAPGSNREIDWVTDAQNDLVRYLIAPTVKRMNAINVGKLTIEIRGGKILFAMLPAEGASDVHQPEQNDAGEPQPPPKNQK